MKLPLNFRGFAMSPELRLSLRALRAFVTVVDCGSITGAAGQLHIAPSAVAAALTQVEDEMGADLLIRSRAKGITPTPEARALAARFRALLEDYGEALDWGRQQASRLAGPLRIGYYAPVAPAFLPHALGALLRDHPGITLELSEHDNDSAQEALLSGALDLILFTGGDLRPGIALTPLLDLPPYVLMPEGHPLASVPHPGLGAVADYPLVQLDRPVARPYVEALFAAADIRPRIAARATATEMVRSLVGAGHGIAVLNMRPLTDRSYGDDALAARPLAGDLPPLQLAAGHALRHPRRTVTACLDALTRWRTTPAAQALIVE
ncbi:LysR family transcriptional regulator [Roseovarius sp. C7]|uniref:LysR family transcriptional regulator n=1 Tax=Roseovarius sp. C7 TaxID=3398643 RepID=UPI0039F70808